MSGTYLFGQGTAISVPVDVSDGVGGQYVLTFGLHPDATDGLDPALGEEELPPAPPAGIFDTRFQLPNSNIATLKDLRQGNNQTTGSFIHNVKWQLGTGSSGYTLSWNLPSGVEINLKDPFGGVIFNVTFGEGPGTYTVTNTAFTSLTLTATYSGTVINPIAAPTNLMAEALVLGEIALSWNDNADNETNYVVERKNTGGFELYATLAANSTTFTDMDVVEGTTYTYRVKGVNSETESDYSNEASATALTGGTGTGISVPLQINDGVGGTQILTFGLHPDATDGLDPALGEEELPPAPPAGIFDTRFQLPNSTIGSLKDLRQGNNQTTGSFIHNVKWQLGTGSSGYTLSWNLPSGVEINLKDPFGGVIFNVTFGEGPGTYTVTNTAFTSLTLTATYSTEAPGINAPSDLSAENLGIGSVALTWADNSSNETGFTVEREEGTEKTFTVIATLGENETSYTDNSVAQFTTYNYRVKAFNTELESDYSNVATVTTLGNTAPYFTQYISETTIPVGMYFPYPYDAEDPENDDLIFSSADLPDGATLSPAGFFEWTPQNTGDFTFTVKVSDGDLFDEVTSTIHVVTPVLVKAGTVQAAPGHTVYVPVTAMNFNNVGAITFKIAYDPAVLTYQALTNYNPQITGALANASNGFVNFSWVDNTFTGINVPDGKLFDIKFTYIGGESGIDFNIAGCEVSDPEGNLITVFYENGNVSVAPVTVTTPNGGENIFASSDFLIEWLTFNIAQVDLAYSTDGGNNFETIATGLNASTGSYQWAVPNTPTTSALIKISDASNPMTYDVSDAYFSILPSTYSVSGLVQYDNTANTTLSNVSVSLMLGGQSIGTDLTGSDGAYQIDQVENGTYTISSTTTKAWGGVNSTDALLVRRHTVGLTLLEGLRLVVADVNGSNSVNSTDALLIRRRTVGLDPGFAAGDWKFTKPDVTVAGQNATQNLLGLTVGDVNASYSNIPIAKSTEFLALSAGTKQYVKPGETFELPVSVNYNADIAAITAGIKYDSDNLSFKSIRFAGSGLVFNENDGLISIAWDDLQPLQVKAGETLFSLVFKVSENADAGTTFDFQTSAENEFADVLAKSIDLQLSTNSVEIFRPTDFSLKQNYPNPFNPSTTITYDLPNNSSVTLEVYSIVGEKVATIVNQSQKAGSYEVTFDAGNLASGIYVYRLNAVSPGSSFTRALKMMLMK